MLEMLMFVSVMDVWHSESSVYVYLLLGELGEDK